MEGSKLRLFIDAWLSNFRWPVLLDASTFNELIAIAAAVCDIPEVCGRPCRADSVIDVPTNSVSSSSGMTLCEEGDLGYKIQLAAYKAANLG